MPEIDIWTGSRHAFESATGEAVRLPVIDGLLPAGDAWIVAWLTIIALAAGGLLGLYLIVILMGLAFVFICAPDAEVEMIGGETVMVSPDDAHIDDDERARRPRKLRRPA